MKAIRYGISVAFVAGFASMAACGGSTDGGGDAAAGNSAGGASSKAGAPGAAGRTAGGAGATNPGLGGAMNNSACPAAAPADATACTLTGMQNTCTYTGMRCSCARARTGGGMVPGAAGAGAGTREWQCTATLVCPATKPTVGAACTPADGNCQYSGMGSCSCSQQTSTWSCRGGAGGGTGGAFNGGGGGFSFGGGFNGVGGTSSAGAPGGTTTCPATKPSAGTACTGTDACPYTGGGCVCVSDQWSCL